MNVEVSIRKFGNCYSYFIGRNFYQKYSYQIWYLFIFQTSPCQCLLLPASSLHTSITGRLSSSVCYIWGHRRATVSFPYLSRWPIIY